MKVWIVAHMFIEDFVIDGVFSSLELAQVFMDGRIWQKFEVEPTITEYDVDAPL